MERIKITVANSNLARKVNAAYEGDLTRAQRRARPQQASPGPPADAREADVGPGRPPGLHSGQTHVLLQALLVPKEGLSDDGWLTRRTAKWTSSATATT